MINLEKGEHIIEEYSVSVAGKTGFFRLVPEKLTITNKKIIFSFSKTKGTISIPIKKLIIHKLNIGKGGENELNLKYFDENGKKQEIIFTAWDIKKGFLKSDIIDITSDVYNLINNIITRYGIDIQDDVNYCEGCGTKLKDNAKFCKKCGKKIK